MLKNILFNKFKERILREINIDEISDESLRQDIIRLKKESFEFEQKQMDKEARAKLQWVKILTKEYKTGESLYLKLLNERPIFEKTMKLFYIIFSPALLLIIFILNLNIFIAFFGVGLVDLSIYFITGYSYIYVSKLLNLEKGVKFFFQYPGTGSKTDPIQMKNKKIPHYLLLRKSKYYIQIFNCNIPRLKLFCSENVEVKDSILKFCYIEECSKILINNSSINDSLEIHESNDNLVNSSKIGRLIVDLSYNNRVTDSTIKDFNISNSRNNVFKISGVSKDRFENINKNYTFWQKNLALKVLIGCVVIIFPIYLITLFLFIIFFSSNFILIMTSVLFLILSLPFLLVIYIVYPQDKLLKMILNLSDNEILS